MTWKEVDLMTAVFPSFVSSSNKMCSAPQPTICTIDIRVKSWGGRDGALLAALSQRVGWGHPFTASRERALPSTLPARVDKEEGSGT